MKRILLICAIITASLTIHAQTKTPGPAEAKLTAALCDCIQKIDMSKITNSKEANKAFMDCFTNQADLVVDIAAERGVTMDDDAAMNKIGNDIGQNLVKQKCEGFMKLAVKMADKGDDEADEQTTSGTFKRIDNKGFNYVVLTDATGKEKSFLWLREFGGSDKLMEAPASLTGKKLKLSWKEMEVYLPAAKGYYKVKEITGIELL